MVLTTKQEEGLKIAVERFKSGEPWTCISGYAGSGKSTLVKFIIQALKVPEEQVCYVAYTGKAATVLKQKGCANAMTAHKLLNWASPTPSGKFVIKTKNKFEDY
jgi:exodeoxyribonuclease-5